MPVPGGLFEREQTSETGDGVLFTTADERAKPLVGALDNLDAHSPRSYQRYIERESYPGLRVDYAPVVTLSSPARAATPCSMRK